MDRGALTFLAFIALAVTLVMATGEAPALVCPPNHFCFTSPFSN